MLQVVEDSFFATATQLVELIVPIFCMILAIRWAADLLMGGRY